MPSVHVLEPFDGHDDVSWGQPPLMPVLGYLKKLNTASWDQSPVLLCLDPLGRNCNVLRPAPAFLVFVDLWMRLQCEPKSSAYMQKVWKRLWWDAWTGWKWVVYQRIPREGRSMVARLMESTALSSARQGGNSIKEQWRLLAHSYLERVLQNLLSI